MDEGHENDPLHGITLEAMLLSLLEKYGWEGLAERIPVKCFSSEPSVKSSLTFLRRTPWARSKVEKLYLGKLKSRRPARKPGPARAAPPRDAARPSAGPRDKGGTAKREAPAPQPKAKEGGRRYPGIWVDEQE